MQEITIDKLGRIVIPKNLREKLNLKQGTCLSVETTEDNTLVIKVIEDKPHLEYKGNILVYKNKLNNDYVDYQNITRDDRSTMLFPHKEEK